MPGSRPADFPGTAEQIAANEATHRYGEDARCYGCDCRPWGWSCQWPCGADIPRVEW